MHSSRGMNIVLPFSIVFGERYFVTPPVQKSYYQAEQRGVKKEGDPRPRRAKILTERLSFVTQKEITDNLHDNGERAAGDQNSVKKQIPRQSGPSFFGPVGL